MTYQHPIVDRATELDIFEAMFARSEDRGESILLLKDGSGQGKSKLIQLYEKHCRENHVPVSRVDFKGGALNPSDVLRTIEMDFRPFSNLQRCNEILYSTVPAPSIQITDNISLGSAQYNVQIEPMNEWILETQRILWEMSTQAMLDALFASTSAGQENFVILFDTYEQASEEIKRWLSKHILRMSTPQRIGSLLIVVAGKDIPPPTGEWESCCKTIHLQPLQLEHWKEYARQLADDISEELIERVYARYRHSPLDMATIINSLSPLEKTSYA